MGLSTALFNAVSGLTALSESLNVIGDNLANVNTPGFKASTARFATVFSQTLTGASAPTGNLFGTNPIQLGLGTTLATIDKSFTQGSLLSTGNLSDLAVQGNGFFILSDGVGVGYTRDGSFALAVDGTLVDPATGLAVQGYQAVNGVVTPTGSVGNIVIPIGTSIVQETSNALFTGNFDASGDIATTGTVLDGPPLDDSGGGVATLTTPLINLENDLGISLGIQPGDIITITGRRGGADITSTFEVEAGPPASTVSDLLDAIRDAFGIVNGTVELDMVNNDGSIIIRGDVGTGNDITDVALTAADPTTGTPRTEFNTLLGSGSAFTGTPADGESFVLSGLTVFDSLGNSVPMTITFTRTGERTVEYLAESPFGTPVGSGTITYDPNGQFLSVDNDLINIDRSGSGAASPLNITLDFSATTFLSGVGTLALASQDGYPIGSLEEFYVGNNGIITGSFSNGLTLVQGQVALAIFPNEEGLLSLGENIYVTSANSGEAIVGEAGTGGRGTMVQGYLEGSNTDMATEFTNIIIAQRGFQANARTITAADTLMEEVISLVR